MSSKIRLLVFASILLNFLLAGVVIGFAAHKFLRHHSPEGYRQMMASLPADKQQTIKQSRKKLHAESRELRRQMRAHRERIKALLSAEDFDENAYRQAMQDMHDLRGQHMQQLSDEVARLAKSWSRDERRALGKLLMKPPHHHRQDNDPPPVPEEN